MKQWTKNNKLFLFLGLSTGFAYLLMVMGTFVTSTGSGLGCPDWPLCFGTVAPPLEMQVWFEWGHRLLGGATGILLIVSTVMVWKNYKGLPMYMMFGVLGLLLAAALFGGLIVHTEAPLLESFTHVLIISSHLLIATIVLTLLLFTMRSVKGSAADNAGKGWFAFVFLAIFAQVIVGIFVRYSSATLACPDFPLCHGSLVPDFMNQKIAMQLLHRAIGFGILAICIYGVYKAVTEKSADVMSHVVTLGLVILQATFGASVVLSGMFLPFIILHGATGFLLLGWLAFKSAPYFLPSKDKNAASA